MRSDLNILSELQKVSTAVAAISHQTPYRAPEGFFDTLPEVILARIIARREEEPPIVGLAGKEPVFNVPAGYFEGLSNEILARLHQQEDPSAVEELKALSPVLAAAPRTVPYQVPAGYFESLVLPGAQTNQPAPTAKVVSMSSSRLWVRFAAAAAVLLLITGSIYFFPDSSTNADIVKEGLLIQTEEEFQQSLAEVDNKDLIQYLKTTSIGFSDENLPSMVESSTLPEETEYLDQEFLDSYMEELEKETSTTDMN